MSAAKIYYPRKIASIILWTAGFIWLFISCDVLEPDADSLLSNYANITDNRVYVVANNTTFIDLSTKIQTNKPVRLRVTSTTRHGSLSDLGQGLLQYSPTVGNKKATDSFQFTVYGDNNEVIRTDSVNIIIENDATHLPCQILTVNDYVYGVKKNQSVRVNVLANDHICGVDSSSLVLSIYRPESSFPPHFGIARVSGTSIIYTPGTSFQEKDSLIYKIFPQGHADKAVYGMVYINGTQLCRVTPRDDSYVFTKDSLSHAVLLPVFQNDSLCDTFNNVHVAITEGPTQGAATINAAGFTYIVSKPSGITAIFTDQFTYEVCVDAICKTAFVKIRVKSDSGSVCLFQAMTDSFNLTVPVSATTSYDVLRNDSICGGYTNFTLTQLPHYGTAAVSNGKIAYTLDPLMNKNDSLEYQICNAQKCSRAKVYIKREH
jgi:hypothetical protein